MEYKNLYQELLDVYNEEVTIYVNGVLSIMGKPKDFDNFVGYGFFKMLTIESILSYEDELGRATRFECTL